LNPSVWAIGYLALLAVAVFCGWRAIQGARTPQGSVAWVVFLLSVPVVAVPAYLFLGHHRLRGVEVARRDSAPGSSRRSMNTLPSVGPKLSPRKSSARSKRRPSFLSCAGMPRRY